MHNIKIGNKDVKFVRSRGEVVYPDYVKDGLVLWYDFSGMENSGVKRGVAEDLSGNGNDGELRNFAFDTGSGYADNGLEFDGVDDYLIASKDFNLDREISISITFSIDTANLSYDLMGLGNTDYVLRVIDGTALQIIDKTHNPDRISILNILHNYNRQIELCIVSSLRQTTVFVNSVKVYEHIFNEDRIALVSTLRIGTFNRETFVSGYIYNSKIYNRLLTPEEIAHNFKIDKHRFNIQD